MEVVNKYVYLGFEFTTKMSVTSSLSSFVIKAKHALNALFRSLNTIDCHEHKIFLNYLIAKYYQYFHIVLSFGGYLILKILKRFIH